jgi:hypothetical protein
MKYSKLKAPNGNVAILLASLSVIVLTLDCVRGSEPPSLFKLKSLLGTELASSLVKNIITEHKLIELSRIDHTTLSNAKPPNRHKTIRVTYGTFSQFYRLHFIGHEYNLGAPKQVEKPLKLSAIEIVLNPELGANTELIQNFLPQGITYKTSVDMLRQKWPRPEHESVDDKGNGYSAFVWPMRDRGDGVIFEFVGGKLSSVRYE